MNKVLILTLALLLPLAAAAESTAENQVREAVAGFNATYAANDLDAYFDYYDPDATLLFGQERSTVAEYRAGWSELIAAGGGIEKNEISDVQLRLIPGGDAAAVTYRIEVHTRSVAGEVTRERAVETDVWVRRDGGWRIVSLHYSPVPMSD